MSTEGIRAFRLELESDSEPIRGRLMGEAESAVEFVGWLGLASALEKALETLTSQEET